MNIDSSNILSLLSSGGDLENIQQALTAEGSMSEEFSDALMDKISLLNNTVSGANDLTENGMANMLGGNNKLHGFAGLMNEKGTAVEFSRLFGNGLPGDVKLEKGIDLENTLQALASVVNTLEGVDVDKADLNTRLDSLIEKVGDIKEKLPSQSELPEKLLKIANTLETIVDSFIHKEKSIDNTELTNTIELTDASDLETIVPIEGFEHTVPDVVEPKIDLIKDTSQFNRENQSGATEQVNEDKGVEVARKSAHALVEPQAEGQNQEMISQVKEGKGAEVVETNANVPFVPFGSVAENSDKTPYVLVESQAEGQNQEMISQVKEGKGAEVVEANANVSFGSVAENSDKTPHVLVKPQAEGESQEMVSQVKEGKDAEVVETKANVPFGRVAENSDKTPHVLVKPQAEGESQEMISQVKEANAEHVFLEPQLERQEETDGVPVPIESLEPMADQEQAEKKDELTPLKEGYTPAYLAEQLEKVAETINQIKDIASIEDGVINDNELTEKLNDFISDVVGIKDVATKLVATKLPSSNEEMSIPLEVDEELDSDILVENQIAALIANLADPKDREVALAMPVTQEGKVDIKRDNITLKQTMEGRVVGAAVNEGEESLLQQENALRKPGQENPIIAAKQSEKIELFTRSEPEQNLDKALPRFATDIANLNRAVMANNKPELPPMTKHFADPEWNKEMSERVIWMHKQAVPSAELRLNPGHLGPITIKVDVSQDQVTVAFTAQHAAVKEAIEASLPKLRELFSAQQLNLTSVDVSQDDSSQKQPRGFAQMGSDTGKDGNKEPTENGKTEDILDISEEIEAGRAIASNGLLSIFA